MKKKLVVGLLALIIANIIWGVMSPLLKDLLNTGTMSGMTVSAIRMIICTALFWVLSVILPKKVTQDTGIAKKDIKWMAIGGVIFIIGTQTLTNIGAEYTYPVDASMCCSATPIFTLILGAIFYHRKFPPMLKIVGVLLGLAGVLIFIFATDENPEMHVTNPFLGDTLCVLSQLFGAIYLVFFIPLVARYSCFTLMKWLYTFATIAILPFTFGDVIAVPWAELSAMSWFELSFIVILGSFVGYLLIAVAQKKVTPTLIAVCNYIQPISTAIFAAIMGLAVITHENVIATILIFVGVWLVNMQSDELIVEKK
ncbi:MAG: DMT family transporter [Prevotellaceae bacterium]|nr:DMT family transporter [Prevotellaceae bacterium]